MTDDAMTYRKIGAWLYDVDGSDGQVYRVQLTQLGDDDPVGGVCNCRGYEAARRTGHACKHIRAMLRVAIGEAEQMTDETTAVAVRDNTPPLPVLADAPPTALLPTQSDLAAMMAIAKQAPLAKGMVPANIQTPEQALAVILAGWELGLRPMTALRHVYVVNGKTEIETRAMVGIIRARDPQITFSWPQYTQTAVTCIIERPGQPQTLVTYTVEDAVKSGQMGKGGVWKAYTRDMLYAAATKRACRLACPDLINAIEGSMQTVRGAVELAMPAISARVVEMPDTPQADIPPTAFNDGDDQGALSPEVAPPDPLELHAEVIALIKEARQTWDKETFSAWAQSIRAQFPNSFDANGRAQLHLMDIDDLIAMRDKIGSDVHPQPEASSTKEPHVGDFPPQLPDDRSAD